MEKIILFGLNYEAKKLFDIYGTHGKQFDLDKWIVAIADNNEALWNTAFHGKMVISPKEINKYEFDKIIICPGGKAEEEIRKQLIEEYGISEEKLSYLYRYMTLPQDKIKNCKILVNRESALSYFEKNLVIAEVGVAFGSFSKKLLKYMSPKKFYALDYFFANNPYLKGLGGMWDNPNFKKSGLTMIEYYKETFSEQIKNEILEVKQGYSWELLETFADDTFDYIYLDAAHDFESVTKDIEVIKRKIKKGGIVQFNDYGFVHAATKGLYGVLPAVNNFLWESECEVLFYCINSNGLMDLAVRIDE